MKSIYQTIFHCDFVNGLKKERLSNLVFRSCSNCDAFSLMFGFTSNTFIGVKKTIIKLSSFLASRLKLRETSHLHGAAHKRIPSGMRLPQTKNRQLPKSRDS